jgi:hypothetical protein
MLRRTRIGMLGLIASLALVSSAGLAQTADKRTQAAKGQPQKEQAPPSRYPRVELEQFLSNPAKYHDHRMTVRGDVSKAGTYYAFTNPKNARDRRYAKLELTDQQRDWIRMNCQAVCIVDVKAKAKQGAPFGRLKVRTIEKAPLD